MGARVARIGGQQPGGLCPDPSIFMGVLRRGDRVEQRFVIGLALPHGIGCAPQRKEAGAGEHSRDVAERGQRRAFVPGVEQQETEQQSQQRAARWAP